MECLIFIIAGYLYSLQTNKQQGGDLKHTVTLRKDDALIKKPITKCEQYCNNSFDLLDVIQGQNDEQGLKDIDVESLREQVSESCKDVLLLERHQEWKKESKNKKEYKNSCEGQKNKTKKEQTKKKQIKKLIRKINSLKKNRHKIINHEK